jgi:two-component system sensor histidine kinase AtoS
VELFPESDSHRKAKKLVEIEFRDTGKGIPAEFLSKIFDPYFTLKKAGTGLGLSIVKKIMTDHGGEVVIYSEEAKGTTVTLRFPVTDQGDL